MQSSPKILDLEDLARCVQVLKAQGKRVVHCHGVFDLFHVGHLRHFEEARSLGDVLVVTLTPDQYVNKGPHRPAFPQQVRAEVVAALDVADYVAINRWPTAVETIKLLRPHVYAKGPDYRDRAQDATGAIFAEEEAIRAVGGQVKITDGVTFSSSSLLNRFLPSLPPEVTSFLKDFRGRYTSREIIGFIESLWTLKVLVVGEAILDEYVYCDAMGKSAKEPILAMRYLSQEMHAGGALAIANHVAEFCDRVDVLTYLGTINTREDFIRGRLKPGVNPTFIYKSGSPTIVKRRYVENYLLAKVFEVYEMNDEFLNAEEDHAFCTALENRLADYDLVIAADFGHGLISARASEILRRGAPFLAVNTQMNAANVGFHTVSKYARADYACIQEGEIRLDSRSRKGEIRTLVADLSRRLDCPMITVTQGKRGALIYRRGEEGEFSECPAFALNVVDRVGAGDAVLAVSSLCAARQAPADVTGFLGNLAGAQAVMIVGNSASVDRVRLIKSVESLLK